MIAAERPRANNEGQRVEASEVVFREALIVGL